MKKIFEDIISAIADAGACDASCEYDRGYDDAISVAIAAVKYVVSGYKNGWIPANEKMPDEPGEYLTQSSTGGMLVLQYYKGWNCFPDANGTVYNVNEITDIVAWQPLPDVFKAKF